MQLQAVNCKEKTEVIHNTYGIFFKKINLYSDYVLWNLDFCYYVPIT